MPYLFPLALRGTGTQEVEALSSYLHRLASLHSVTVGQLLRHVYSWYAADNPAFRQNPPITYQRGDLPVYVRPNAVTEELFEALTHASGQLDLRSGTFLALQTALDRAMGTFSKRFRWCPGCMREFEKVDDDGYFKLLWHLEAVTHCPTHALPLEGTCPTCGSPQGGYGRKGKCTACQKCGGSLGLSADKVPLASSWETHGADLIQLVEVIGTTPDLRYRQGAVRGVVSALYDRAWQRGDEKAFWALIPRDECIAVDSGHQPLTLMVARRLAFRLGMTLHDLLSGAVDLSSDILDPAWVETLPSEMRPKKRRQPRDRKALLDRLTAVLASYAAANPPALQQVAKDVGVSKGCLCYHFPVRAHEIAERHREWHEEHQHRQVLTARAAALEFFTHERYRFEPKSRRQAFLLLRAQTGLPKNVLREAIATTCTILQKRD